MLTGPLAVEVVHHDRPPQESRAAREPSHALGRLVPVGRVGPADVVGDRHAETVDSTPPRKFTVSTCWSRDRQAIRVDDLQGGGVARAILADELGQVEQYAQALAIDHLVGQCKWNICTIVCERVASQ